MDLDHIDRKQCDKGDDQHGQGDGRGAGVIDVIELLHDDVGYDLGVILGAVAGNVDDTAVFAEAPGKSQAEARQQGRPQFREDDAPEMVNCDAPSILPASSYVGSSFSRTGWIERTTNGMPTKDHGDGQTDLGVGDLDAIAGKETVRRSPYRNRAWKG